MTQLLDMSGKRAAPAETTAKLDHDADALKRERDRFNALLKDLFRKYMTDLHPPEDQAPVVNVDREALRQHYGEQYAEAARTMNKTGFPHPIEEDALYKTIDQWHQGQEEQQALMRQVVDAEGVRACMSMQLVGQTKHGTLLINSDCAMAVNPDGYTFVWTRGTEPLDSWCQGWLPEPKRWPRLCNAMVSMQHVMNLIGAEGKQGVADLPAGMLARARRPRRLFL